MRKEYKFLIAILLLGFLWRLGFSWQPLEKMVAFPVVDDGFYSLSIARNIASGAGMTCDGVNPTNGFQPLYVFLAVPFYWLFPQNKILPLNLILTCLSVLSVISGYFIYKLVDLLSNKTAALFAVLVWSLSPTVIEFELNGLETGLNVFFIILTSYYYLSRIRGKNSAPLNNYIILGSLLGLTILSRIDSSIYCLFMGLDFLIVNRRDLVKNLRYFFLVVFACIAVASPWFLNNFFRFGSIMPVSGQAVRLLSLSPTASRYYQAGTDFPINPIPMGYYLANLRQALFKMGRAPLIEAIFWPGLLLGRQRLGYFLLLTGISLFTFLAFYDRKKTGAYFKKAAGFNYALPFFVTMLGAYSFYIFTQWYYVRYFFPLLFISIIYCALAYDLSLNEIFPKISVKAAKWINSAFVIFLFLSFNYRLAERLTGKETPGNETHQYYKAARWIEKNLPPDAQIGAFQSGTIGYFSKAVNLDGVVNQKAHIAMKNKRMLNYIEASGIEYIIDWPWMVEDYLWKSSPPDSNRNRMILLKENIYGYNLYQVIANKS